MGASKIQFYRILYPIRVGLKVSHLIRTHLTINCPNLEPAVPNAKDRSTFRHEINPVAPIETLENILENSELELSERPMNRHLNLPKEQSMAKRLARRNEKNKKNKHTYFFKDD